MEDPEGQAGFDGKEGVEGSSPPEGLGRKLRIRGFARFWPGLVNSRDPSFGSCLEAPGGERTLFL